LISGTAGVLVRAPAVLSQRTATGKVPTNPVTGKNRAGKRKGTWRQGGGAKCGTDDTRVGCQREEAAGKLSAGRLGKRRKSISATRPGDARCDRRRFPAWWHAVMPKRVIASVLVAAIVLALTGVVLSVIG
jgi:hypothetical protein